MCLGMFKGIKSSAKVPSVLGLLGPVWGCVCVRGGGLCALGMWGECVGGRQDHRPVLTKS